jgi:ceramide glucosyltransferase
MMAILAGLAAVLAGIGVAEGWLASWLVAAFARRRRAPAPVACPPLTVLKPLHGDEPLLEEALTTLCRQDYPIFQIVFGLQDAADPAVAVVRRMQARFPDLDIALVIDSVLHGRNRKVSNLINMMSAARHDVLVIADADVHVRPDYLECLVAALEQPGVGLVTTLYAGLPAIDSSAVTTPVGVGSRMPGPSPVVTRWRMPRSLPARLGATQITHGFLPGAVVARALGRQDCLGATMCLRRRDLERVGGIRALVDHLADDNVLGRRIVALGLSVVLAETVPLTTVPEATLRALFRHELRWARTIRALEPIGFTAAALQYPLAWALLAILLSGGALWSIGCFLLVWVLRAVAALSVDRALAPSWTGERTKPRGAEKGGTEERSSNDVAALAFSCPVWLLPLRDALSVAIVLASYGGRQVDWRGHGLHADTPPPLTQQSVTHRPATRRPLEGTNAR